MRSFLELVGLSAVLLYNDPFALLKVHEERCKERERDWLHSRDAADFHQKVPSPIPGFVGVPKAVLQAIVPIPGALGSSGIASFSGTASSRN
jgi:hypothetical protein